MPNSARKDIKAHKREVRTLPNRPHLLIAISFPFKSRVSCRPLQKLRLTMQRPLQEEDQQLHLRMVELQKLLLPQILQYAILNRHSQHQLHR